MSPATIGELTQRSGRSWVKAFHTIFAGRGFVGREPLAHRRHEDQRPAVGRLPHAAAWRTTSCRRRRACATARRRCGDRCRRSRCRPRRRCRWSCTRRRPRRIGEVPKPCISASWPTSRSPHVLAVVRERGELHRLAVLPRDVNVLGVDGRRARGEAVGAVHRRAAPPGKRRCHCSSPVARSKHITISSAVSRSAEVTNTRLFHTTGELWPRPGSGDASRRSRRR